MEPSSDPRRVTRPPRTWCWGGFWLCHLARMVFSLALSCPLILFLFPLSVPTNPFIPHHHHHHHTKEGRGGGGKTRRRRATPPARPCLPSQSCVFFLASGTGKSRRLRAHHTHTHATFGNRLAQIPPGAKHGARAPFSCSGLALVSDFVHMTERQKKGANMGTHFHGPNPEVTKSPPSSYPFFFPRV